MNKEHIIVMEYIHTAFVKLTYMSNKDRDEVINEMLSEIRYLYCDDERMCYTQWIRGIEYLSDDLDGKPRLTLENAMPKNSP